MTEETKPLQPRQLLFVKFYLADPARNGTQAAIAAGYKESGAANQANKLLKNPRILAEIARQTDEIIEESGVTPKMVMEELARMAFFRPEDFVSIDPETGLLKYDVTADNLDKLKGVTGVQMVAGNLRFTANKEKALEMLVRILELEAGDDDEAPVIVEYHVFPDDENSERTAAGGSSAE